ncbi:MAG TPA: hypothetical protein VN363_05000, partial [Anaerolineales bacterium]|nr:hypothetical protein [Anaerolineales bacterium]
MDNQISDRLQIPTARLDAINSVLGSEGIRVVEDLLKVVEKYGTPEEINRKAEAARQLPALYARVEAAAPHYLEDLKWLEEQRDQQNFISIQDYRRKLLGTQADQMEFSPEKAITLEVSAAQYFPFLIHSAQRAIDEETLLPGRFIRVRKMKEQEKDGDLPAFTAAMQIIGASCVETLDTKGTDGSNIHLNGPETITGYFGGIGQPNDYPLKWADELLYYITEYGISQVLNTNSGTVLVGYMLYKLGINFQFKISVFMGNDNPYAGLWTLIGAKLFAREDGSSPLCGLNWSNSINNDTIENSAQFRKQLGFEQVVRFEHHITETYKSIVRQPYNRRDELVEIAPRVANISAKHEGGEPEIDCTREHPSDILDYFRDKEEIIQSGDWANVELNYMDKIDAVNHTAEALTRSG